MAVRGPFWEAEVQLLLRRLAVRRWREARIAKLPKQRRGDYGKVIPGTDGSLPATEWLPLKYRGRGDVSNR